MYLMDAVTAGFTTTQISSITDALGTAVNGVLDTFIALLPIIAVTVAISFGIKFVMARFNSVKKGR